MLFQQRPLLAEAKARELTERVGKIAEQLARSPKPNPTEAGT